MPDQEPNSESDDRPVLDSDNLTDEHATDEEPSSSPRQNTPPADSEDPEPTEQHDSTVEDQEATATASEPEVSEEETQQVDNLHFEDENLPETLRHASEEQLDNAPFGIIQVDDEGTIEFFNQYESELSGMDPEEVKGRNFFTQVAPCTNNRLFRGRFKKGIRRGELDETFSYTYTYKMRPTLVDIRLCRDADGDNWITVQKY
jgi:photoactive yellow protein